MRQDEPAMTAAPSPATSRSAVDQLLRDYHDARRREDQWRIPQILLALASPIVLLIALLFTLGGQNDAATISGAVALVAAAGAALLSIEVWRWHRTAIGIGNSVRTDYPEGAALLLRDPL